MSAVPLSRLKKGAVVHIDSIAPNPVFGDLDTLVTRRSCRFGFFQRNAVASDCSRRFWKRTVCSTLG